MIAHPRYTIIFSDKKFVFQERGRDLIRINTMFISELFKQSHISVLLYFFTNSSIFSDLFGCIAFI